MFLRSQFFFYRIYFKITDPIKCIIFSWNPKLENFELSRSSFPKTICYALIGFNILYLCAATFVFVGLRRIDTHLSTVSLASHFLIVTSQWYCLLFRSLYTAKAEKPCVFDEQCNTSGKMSFQ